MTIIHLKQSSEVKQTKSYQVQMREKNKKANVGSKILETISLTSNMYMLLAVQEEQTF